MDGLFRRTSVIGTHIKRKFLEKSVLERVACVGKYYVIWNLQRASSTHPLFLHFSLYFYLLEETLAPTHPLFSPLFEGYSFNTPNVEYEKTNGWILLIDQKMDDHPNTLFEHEIKNSTHKISFESG